MRASVFAYIQEGCVKNFQWMCILLSSQAFATESSWVQINGDQISNPYHFSVLVMLKSNDGYKTILLDKNEQRTIRGATLVKTLPIKARNEFIMNQHDCSISLNDEIIIKDIEQNMAGKLEKIKDANKQSATLVDDAAEEKKQIIRERMQLQIDDPWREYEASTRLARASSGSNDNYYKTMMDNNKEKQYSEIKARLGGFIEESLLSSKSTATKERNYIRQADFLDTKNKELESVITSRWKQINQLDAWTEENHAFNGKAYEIMKNKELIALPAVEKIDLPCQTTGSTQPIMVKLSDKSEASPYYYGKVVTGWFSSKAFVLYPVSGAPRHYAGNIHWPSDVNKLTIKVGDIEKVLSRNESPKGGTEALEKLLAESTSTAKQLRYYGNGGLKSDSGAAGF